MDLIAQKFAKLGVDNAPGQETRKKETEQSFKGAKLEGRAVDFSHGDVDAHEPIPGSLECFIEGVNRGGSQAYTEYRGGKSVRDDTARKLSKFVGRDISPDSELIITPGTQCALFLAMGATVARGDRVAIVEPDYFANRKLVSFFDGELFPVNMDYYGARGRAGIDLKRLEEGFKSGVKLFLFSNPNNPVGTVYSKDEISAIAELAGEYAVTVIVDQLYSRQLFDGVRYTHFCSEDIDFGRTITIMGPSKTESLSGYRLGVAFGGSALIDRMEKLQAIVSLRAAGYCQAVLQRWFEEPDGWMERRIDEHRAIRDELLAKLLSVEGVEARATEAGSYLFPRLPKLTVSMQDFVSILRAQASVTVTPGTEFGPQFTDSFRINFSQDRKAAADAIDRVIELIERYRL